MVVLCFVLDLCSLSPPLLRDLKQCLLQLANFYAISSPSRHQPDSLKDRIGLCYIYKNRISCSHELKIAYSPRGNFSLRDFHCAINDMPSDAFLPEINDSGALRSCDVNFSSILSDQVLYSWEDKDIMMRKVIVLSSCLPENLDLDMKNNLMDAAEKCVSVEFVLFEQSSSHLCNLQENINNFVRSLSDLDNCSFQTYLSDGRVFHGLVKRWLQDLKEDMEEPLQARFIFESNLVGSLNQLLCSLSISVGQVVDGFSACQTCRCHGAPLDGVVKDKDEWPSCPVTGHDLGKCDVIENSVKVGEEAILYMPSFKSCMKFQQASLPIEFNVIERTNLRSLSEGVIIGSSYFVTPSVCQETETSLGGMDMSGLNAQLFQGICGALHSMDQGLVCSSFCNVETMKEAAFHCYYILEPSDNGPMLLRRLAAAEEVSPMPDASQLMESSVTKEIQNSIQDSLLKMELRDYNPVLHERGFHQKLNLLVKESLQFGSIPPQQIEAKSKLNLNQPDSSEIIVLSNSVIDPIIVEEQIPPLENTTMLSNSVIDPIAVEEEAPQLDLTARQDQNTTFIAEEWEQLVVNEVSKVFSPTCVSKPKMDQLVLSPPDGDKQLDVNTSRILERLEAPRQLKTKAVSPIVISSGFSETCVPTKKPLIPFQPIHATEQSLTSSQLMKPSFQRLKRKHV